MTYIIQYKASPLHSWQRSYNAVATKILPVKTFLSTYAFATREEAEAEAAEQQKYMGGKYEYRVFPEALSEVEALDKIKAVLDAPTPKTKLEQIKAMPLWMMLRFSRLLLWRVPCITKGTEGKF
jgi:hypothetical protein